MKGPRALGPTKPPECPGPGGLGPTCPPECPGSGGLCPTCPPAFGAYVPHNYDALHCVIVFSLGEYGWQLNIPQSMVE